MMSFLIIIYDVIMLSKLQSKLIIMRLYEGSTSFLCPYRDFLIQGYILY